MSQSYIIRHWYSFHPYWLGLIHSWDVYQPGESAVHAVDIAVHVTDASVEYQHPFCLCLWLGCVAQVLLARGEVFGVDASWEQRGGLFFRHTRGNHHAVSRLEEETHCKKSAGEHSSCSGPIAIICAFSCCNNWQQLRSFSNAWHTFQSAGVATRFPAVSWSESTTLKISSKLRPVVAG